MAILLHHSLSDHWIMVHSWLPAHVCTSQPSQAIAPTLLLAYALACAYTFPCVHKCLNLELGYGLQLLSYLLHLNLNIILSALPDFGFVTTFLIHWHKVQRIYAYGFYLDVCMTAGIFAIWKSISELVLLVFFFFLNIALYFNTQC